MLLRRMRGSVFAGVAELADAHGSGPCDSNIMRVQVPSPASVSQFLACRSLCTDAEEDGDAHGRVWRMSLTRPRPAQEDRKRSSICMRFFSYYAEVSELADEPD